MEITSNLISFGIVAIIMLVFGFLTVSATRMLRSAAYLMFVLIAAAVVYIFLNYHFLAMVQIAVYAGGILVLFVFSILLTSNIGERVETTPYKNRFIGGTAAASGLVLTLWVIWTSPFEVKESVYKEIDMAQIGTALMSTEKGGYMLAFEVISILLLACIIAGILIARKK